MAYLAGKILSTEGLNSASSVTVDISGIIEENDLILHLFTKDGNIGTISSTGYSNVPGTTQTNISGTQSAALYKIAGASESNPTITFTSDQYVCITLIYRDVDTVSPFDGVGEATGTGTSISSPSVTPANNNGLIVRYVGGYDNNAFSEITADVRAYGILEGNVQNLAAEEAQNTAAATGAYTWNWTASDGGTAWTIVVKKNTDSAIVYTPSVDVIQRYNRIENSIGGVTWTNLSSSIATLDGTTVDTTAFSDAIDRAVTQVIDDTATEIRWASAGPLWQGATHTITSTDFSGAVVSVVLGVGRWSEMADRGVAFILFDSGGNWSAFNLEKDLITSGDWQAENLYITENSTVLDSSGTLDWTDIIKVGVAWDKLSTSTSIRGVIIKDLFVWPASVFTGGGSGWPVRPALFQEYMRPIQTIFNSHARLQGISQMLIPRSLSIGDGVNDVYFVASRESLEVYPVTSGVWQASVDDISYEINATASSTVDFSASITASETIQLFSINAASSTSAAYDFTAATISGYKVTWKTGVPCSGAAFSKCQIVDAKAEVFDGVTVSGSVSTTHAAEIDAGGGFIDSSFIKGAETYAIEIATAGSYDLSGTTFTGYAVNSELNITAASGTVTITLAAGQAEPSYTTAGATVTFVQPTTTFTLDSGETGTTFRLFTTGTQTLLDSATGSSLSYDFTGTVVVDWEAYKAGKIFQRQAGVTLTDTTVNIDLVDDPVYNSSHGLAYTTDASYNRSTKKLTVSTVQDGDDVYSLLIDSFISETSLYNTEFPIQMNGSSAAIFINDAEIIDATSLNKWKRVGVQYVNSSDVVAAEYAAVFTLSSGIPGSAQAEYQQTAGTGTTDAINTGDIDELIQIYGDATHGNFTKNTHLVVKYQVNTYQESRIDIPDLYGITTIQPIAYPVPTPVNSIGITAGDPVITGVTITNHGATPVSWDAGNGAKDYSLTITDTNSNTGENILRWLNYNFSLDATFQGEDPFNWPYMVEQDGTKYRTERGVVEGSAGATLKGVRVIDGSGNPHPDFSEFTADDGTLGIPPAIATFRAANVANGANYMLLHRQTFTITSANINTTLNEITLGNDTNGDAPSFDTTTANRHTLVRLILADGATIPTTTPQIINNGTYRVATESSGVITIEVTEGGGAINFTDAGTNGGAGYVFVAVFETLIAEGTTSGGTGVSESFVLSNNATYRFKTIHQDTTGGPRKTTNFIDVVGAWSSTAGATYTPTVDATDTAQPNLWTEPNRISDLTSYVLEDTVINNNGTVITDFDPVQDGADIGGITFALEGKGFIQINAATLTKNAANLNGAIAGQDLAMWAVCEIGQLDNMWLASDQTLVFNGLSNLIIDNVEFDNTSANLLQVYGANIREKDGSPIVSENTTGPIVANVATRGNVGVIETGTSGLTASEAADLALINTVDTKVDTIDTNVDAILVDTNELQTNWGVGGSLTATLNATATQALLTTVDGKVDTVDTVVDSIKVDTAAILIDTNELQTDWVDGGRLDNLLDATATQANLTTLQADVTAVKAKTDLLTFTVTNVLDANIEYVNSQQINGSGTDQDPWGP